MGTLIKATGEEVDYPAADPPEYTLQEMQKAVGGYIQILRLPDGRIMVLNEEGKFHRPRLLMNMKATAMTRGLVVADDLIVGDVLIASDDEVS